MKKLVTIINLVVMLALVGSYIEVVCKNTKSDPIYSKYNVLVYLTQVSNK